MTELGVRPCVAFLHSGEQANGPAADAEESLIPRLNATEVAEIFTVPLRRFISDVDESGAKSSITYEGKWNIWNSTKWRMHTFLVPRKNVDHNSAEGSYKVWGLTARILLDAARVAYGEDPNFEFNEEFGDEEMIRRLVDDGRLNKDRKLGDYIPRHLVEKEKETKM